MHHSCSFTSKSKEVYLHFHHIKIPPVLPLLHTTVHCACPSPPVLSTRQTTVKARETFKNFFFLFFFSLIVCLSQLRVGQAERCVCHSSKSISTRTAGNAGADPSSKSRLPTPIRSSLFLWKTTQKKPSPDRRERRKTFFLKRGEEKKIYRVERHKAAGSPFCLGEERGSSLLKIPQRPVFQQVLGPVIHAEDVA